MLTFIIPGLQCESCINGYFGDPSGSSGEPTGCSDCLCNGNIDTSDPDSCNRVTGVCTGCLNNSTGAQCERCSDGFYGDAVGAKNCTGIRFCSRNNYTVKNLLCDLRNSFFI